ncbi:MAG: hypothetical protein JW993_04135 [Sedimentisphaerales bacterium]|nr:hypothetical protein [Sedimentisphaerales bacterium]
MEHVRDIELIELVGKRLEAGWEKAVVVHLQSCPRCCEKLAAIRQTWGALGAWEVEAPPRLDSERIVALAAQREGTSATIRLPAAGALLRVAASIVTAAAVGYVGGRWSAGQARTSLPDEPPSYVSALGLEIGETLSALVLDDEQAIGEGS